MWAISFPVNCTSASKPVRFRLNRGKGTPASPSLTNTVCGINTDSSLTLSETNDVLSTSYLEISFQTH
jgi:hypothetical protein